MLSADWISHTLQTQTGGSGPRSSSFSAITTDSRKITSGCLFVALVGESFDGHDFIEKAIDLGAGGILCRESAANSLAGKYPSVHFSGVRDTLTAYRTLGGAWRRRFKIPVILVAGSNGKTTTKELLSAILQGRYGKVLKTQGSQNGFVGIPMTLLELTPEHEIAVIEVGIDEVGAMDQHVKLVEADIAVLTVIGPEHLEKLHDVPTVAREEGIALEQVAKSGGTAVINLDDPWISPFAKSNPGRKIGFTLMSPETSASPSALNDQLAGQLVDDHKKLKLSGTGLAQEMNGITVQLPLPGRHNAQNLLAAIATARAVGLSSQEVLRGLETFRGASGRSELRSLLDGTPVICDYYNASPLSMRAGIAMLTQLSERTGARKIACLGDMLELGAGEESFHRELAAELIAHGISAVFLLGPRMRWLLDELNKQGFSGVAQHFESHETLSSQLLTEMHAGDAVLIKGSRSMKMEEVWKRLEAARGNSENKKP